MLKPILLLTLLASPAFAQKPASFEKRFERMKAVCLTEARSTAEPSIRPVSELGYKQDLLDMTLAPMGKVIAQGVGEIQNLKKSRTLRREAKAKLDQIEDALQGFVAAHPSMTKFQKACAATCASAQLIEYRAWAALDSEAPYAIVDSGQGLCRHFARVAAKLMQKLGLFAWVVGGESKNEDHAWTSVRIENHQYWMEPQHDTCTIYRK